MSGRVEEAGSMNLAAIEPDSMALRLAEVVSRRVGLRPADAVRKVASSLACVDGAYRLAYAERMIAASPRDRDWIDFVELMLVHETYFFRHTAQLDLLRDDILPRLDAERGKAGRPLLVVWIAGCSTGEEAWTMAFLAQEARRATASGEAVPVSILATDLSETSLAAARHGVYDRLHGLDSFRAIPLWAAPYFGSGGGTTAWAVPENLRGSVRFLRHNVLDPPPVSSADLVLCRNTLIYFDEAANRLAQENLVSALRPGGVLVLGPADAPRTKGALEAIGTHAATVYLKTAAAA
jgi:chemotaxis protein methyltransferase CheR